MTATARCGRRVLCVVGTRPEAIKMAPVLPALEEIDGDVEVGLALTGQHDELVGEVLRIFGLRPDFDLAIMRAGQSLADVGRECLARLGPVLEAWRPDLVLVEGDTASVFFGALSAYLHGIPVGHVEAGLRTGNLRSPFPEEGYRRMVAVIADLHFAPTPGARKISFGRGSRRRGSTSRETPSWTHSFGSQPGRRHQSRPRFITCLPAESLPSHS